MNTHAHIGDCFTYVDETAAAPQVGSTMLWAHFG
jgi:hypothetical protein